MADTSIDVLIRGAKVVDGTGNPWFYGDVALAGDRVSAVAAPGRSRQNAREIVDADGTVGLPRLYRYPEPLHHPV